MFTKKNFAGDIIEFPESVGIRIDFDTCSVYENSKCKAESAADLLEWKQSAKIILFYNNQRYDEDTFSWSGLTKESVVSEV